MKRTGDNLKLFGLFLIFLFAAESLTAQNDSVEVETIVSDSQIYEGERTTLKVEVTSRNSKNITRPDAPSINGFRFLSTFPASSTSYSNINGVASMSYSFSWEIEATQKGTYEVPPITLSINGEIHETKPVTITILGVNERPSRNEIAAQPDVFLEMEVSDKNPVRGQQIIAELVIYFKHEMDLSSYQVAQGWVTEGFWQEDLNEHHSARAESVMLDGVRYRRAVLRKHALFPTRQGNLKLQPYRIQANIRNNRDRNSFDFFRGSRNSSRNLNIQSEEVIIKVKDLPDAPSGLFINAVGKLNVDRSLSNQQIKLGESVEIITEIYGSGNIALVSRPDYDLSSHFDVYRPQETTELDKRSGRLGGKKIFRDVIIARKVGKYEVPETEIAIYNDESRQYETVMLPAMSLEVVRDPNAQVGYVSDGRFNITPVTGVVRWSNGDQDPVYRRWWLWVGLIFPVIVFSLAYKIRDYQDKLQYDKLFSRSQNAFSKSEQSLLAAREAMGPNNLKTPYTHIHQALADFITDKIGLPPSGHSDEELAEFIWEKSGREDLAAETQSLLIKCSTIRFTPVSKSENVIMDIRLAKELIERLNKNL